MTDVLYHVEWWMEDRFEVEEPVCDICNDEINEFPAAVLSDAKGGNPHALCMRCREHSRISQGDNQYFETRAFQAGLEREKPGVNFGGRRNCGKALPDLGHP